MSSPGLGCEGCAVCFFATAGFVEGSTLSVVDAGLLEVASLFGWVCSDTWAACPGTPCLLCVDNDADAAVLCMLAESSAAVDSVWPKSEARWLRNLSPNMFSRATEVEAAALGGLGQDPYQLCALRTCVASDAHVSI